MKNDLPSRATEILRKEGVRSFSGKALAYIRYVGNRIADYIGERLESFALPYALLRIGGLKRGCSLSELLAFAFNDCAGLIKPSQVQGEVSKLLAVVSGMKPKVILEIGTANGGTLFLFSHVAPESSTIISVDLPGGGFGGGYPAWRRLLYKSFALSGQRIYLLRADSHKRDTLEQVRATLDGREIDFLFIDGDHTYEGVKRDFEMYGPLVKKAGVIAFHDIAPHPSETGCEVSELWEEMKSRYDHLELVEDQAQNWAGIGVIYIRS